MAYRRFLHTGASHRALRHPREASLLPHSAHSVRASWGPLSFHCSGSAEPPLRVRRHPAASRLRRVPRMLFTHRCVPQGPASSSRSELDAPSTNLKLEIDSTVQSPRGSRRLPPSARHWLHYGRFLVLFVARDKKYGLPPPLKAAKAKKAGRHSAARQFLFI